MSTAGALQLGVGRARLGDDGLSGAEGELLEGGDDGLLGLLVEVGQEDRLGDVTVEPRLLLLRVRVRRRYPVRVDLHRLHKNVLPAAAHVGAARRRGGRCTWGRRTLDLLLFTHVCRSGGSGWGGCGSGFQSEMVQPLLRGPYLRRLPL